MQFPKLTPLQSRFAASLTASILLVIIYFCLWSPHFAYAAELDIAVDGLARGGDDHNWARLDRDSELVEAWQEEELDEDEEEVKDEESSLVEDGTEQSLLAKRVPNGVTALDGSNIPGVLNINAGETNYWVFTNTSLWGNHTDAGDGLPSSLDEDDDGDPNTLYKRDELHKRQSSRSRTIYISINTCLQPKWNGSTTQTAAPPQLTLYVSNSTSNEKPGANVTENTQIVIPLVQGFANHSMNATTDVYMSVAAPESPQNFSGVWNYNLAVSIDFYYHTAHSAPFLHLVDTDTRSALLVTDNLTQARPDDIVYQQWMNLSTPFIVFAQNKDDPAILGVEQSYCGLQTTPAQIMANVGDPAGLTDNVQMGMVTRGLGNKPKEQFYISGLNASSKYDVFLAMTGNSTRSGPGIVGGGGQVWKAVNLTTKSDGNCALIFNLTFCSEVAYAVPSNPYTFPSLDSLSAVYDSYAAGIYQNFNYSLQQIPCNTTSSAQYSLAKNCDDCAHAYKQWLCAVTMPRCEDYSASMPWLQRRNMAQRFLNASQQQQQQPGGGAGGSQQFVLQDLNDNYQPMPSAPSDSNAFRQTYASVMASNSSRNPGVIDQTIMPGPYKEVLPCADLCYSLVQSCPAALGFGCPKSGRGLELDYGQRSDVNGDLTCSYLGAVYYLNSASAGQRSGYVAVGVAGLVAALVTFGGS